MSVSLVLIPLAIAGVSVYRSRHEQSAEVSSRDEIYVESRMRDRELLVSALRDLGTPVCNTTDGALTVETTDGSITMRLNNNGLWTAHFPATWASDRARDFIRDLDSAYGLRVQQAVVMRLRERAPEVGMRITSQSIDNDRVITLVMEVEQ
jgi:hypothetical protein